MFNLKLSAILITVIVVLLGLFYFYYRTTQAERALLIEENAQLEITVTAQKATIDDMKLQAAKISEANINLQGRLANAEQDLNTDFRDIQNSPDTGTEDEIEKRINDDFKKYNRAIESFGSNSLQHH